MAKIIRQIILNNGVICNSKQKAQRELSNQIANSKFFTALIEISECKNNSSILLAIDKHKNELKKLISLMEESEEVANLDI